MIEDQVQLNPLLAQRWSPAAFDASDEAALEESILMVNLCHRYVDGTDWDYSEFSLYDLGQAVAHMTIQAQSLGLFARQFRAFDRDGLMSEFDVPEHWQVTTITAFGRMPRAADAIDPIGAEFPAAARQRRPLSQLSWLTGERR